MLQRKLIMAYQERPVMAADSSARGGGHRPTQFGICTNADDYVIDMW